MLLCLHSEILATYTRQDSFHSTLLTPTCCRFVSATGVSIPLTKSVRQQDEPWYFCELP